MKMTLLHMTNEERSVFSRMVMRWISYLKLCVRSSWEHWRKWDNFEADRRRISAFGRRTIDAENVLRKHEPGKRPLESIEVLQKWAKLTIAFRSINTSAVTGMLQYVALKELNVGEPLFFQGDLPDAYYCVLSGSLALYQFQDKAESKEVHKKYRLMSTETIVETRELLTPGTLGDEVATLKSGIGLGELSLLGIGNVHRACAAVAVEKTSMLVVNPTQYRDFLRKEHLRVLNIRDKIEVLSSACVFKNWISSTITNLAYKMSEVDFIRGEAITAPGEPISELLIIRQGRAIVMHPKGKIALASLEYGGMIGSEVLLRRLAGKKSSALVDTSSKWEVTAASLVKCYRIALDEVVRNCSGSHGQKTFLLLQDMLAVQDQRRRQDFKKQRSWQLQQHESRKKQDANALRSLFQADNAELQSPYQRSSEKAVPAPSTSGQSSVRRYPISNLGSTGGWDIRGRTSIADTTNMLKRLDSNQRHIYRNRSEGTCGQFQATKQGSKKQASPVKELGAIARIRLHRSVADKKFLLVPALPQATTNISADSP